ncbi:triose-phosphate isomerase [soil metagenome]
MTTRQRWVIGNWKMNGRRDSNAALLEAIRAAESDGEISGGIGVCVPFPYLEQAQAALRGTRVALGSQDVSEHDEGAYTGEVSASMLLEFDVSLAVIGHSERRANNAESNGKVARKTVAALKAGLRPVVCVGETLEQRDAGHHHEVVARQLDAVLELVASSLPPGTAAAMIVAYEPVWAIGTGRTATPQQAEEVHASIRARLDSANLTAVPVLYGGSVKGSNAASIFAMPAIDGGLIGGAALIADDFIAIARANQAAGAVRVQAA